MTAVEKLMYKIGLVDQMSGPAKKVTQSITGMQTAARKGMMGIAKGSAGLAAAGYTVAKLTGPAVEMNRALGEVSSLNVDHAELERLEKTSKKFALSYGADATAFVRSAYDIQSAIGGLANGELAAFTNASNLLAKGTKADAATITNYMGTMYGIFEEDAKRLGKAKWVEQMTGQTATAVRLFKTDGMKMSQAFGRLGATATAAGQSTAEQFAVLGSLSATMEGSEAATKYASFIAGVGNAQKTLGLNFSDAQGKMLPTVEILEKIKGKFGDIDTVAEGDLLKKAFGTKEGAALVAMLIGKTGQLRDSMGELAQVDGLGPAEKMAKKMTDAQMKLSGVTQVLMLQLSKGVNTAIAPFVGWLVKAGTATVKWMEKHPTLVKWIGLGTVAVIGITAAISAFALAMGVVSMIKAGVLALKTFAIATKVVTAAQWLWNIAMSANPIGLIIVGIAALIAAIVVVVKNWDLLKWAALACFGKIIEAAKWLGEGIRSGFGAALSFISDMWTLVKAGGQAAFGFLGDAFRGMIGGWLGGLRKLLAVLAKVPGAGKVAKLALEKIDSFGAVAPPAPPEVGRGAADRRVEVPRGGLQQSFSTSRSTNYGGVTINSQQSPSPAAMEEWMAMQLG
jgi:hypothetical protein